MGNNFEVISLYVVSGAGLIGLLWGFVTKGRDAIAKHLLKHRRQKDAAEQESTSSEIKSLRAEVRFFQKKVDSQDARFVAMIADCATQIAEVRRESVEVRQINIALAEYSTKWRYAHVAAGAQYEPPEDPPGVPEWVLPPWKNVVRHDAKGDQ